MTRQRDTRVNGHEADIVERAAALRYGLDRVDELACDGYSTERTRVLPPGTPVEVKACRPRIENGDPYGTCGRWHITLSSHRQLVERDGWYVLAVYDVVDGQHVVVYEWALIKADQISRWVRGYSEAAKLPWTRIIRHLPAAALGGETA